MGGSSGKSKSKSSGSTQYQDRVWGPQGEALQDLYSRATNLFDKMSAGFGDILNQAQELAPYNKEIMDRSLGAQEQLAGGGVYGDMSETKNALMDSLARTSGGSNLGRMYESVVGGSGNTYIDPMVDAMKRSSMENLNTMQAQTGLDAAAAGQGGSSRHAMQNAMLARTANQDMLDREMAMRGGAYDTDLGMKLDIARQADQGIQNTQQRYMDLLSQAQGAQTASAGMGTQLQNLGMGSMAPYMQASNIPWSAATNYANILGRPTILGSGSGRQSGSSKGIGGGVSMKG